MKKLILILVLYSMQAFAGTFDFLNKVGIPITVGIITEYGEQTQLAQPSKAASSNQQLAPQEAVFASPTGKVTFNTETSTIHTIFWIVETKAVYDVAGNLIKPYYREEWQASETVGPVDYEGLATIYPNGRYDFKRTEQSLTETNKQAIKKPVATMPPSAGVKVATNITIGPDINIKPQPINGMPPQMRSLTDVGIGIGGVAGMADEVREGDEVMVEKENIQPEQSVELIKMNAVEDSSALFAQAMQAKQNKNYVLERTLLEQATLEPVPTIWGIKAMYELSELYECGRGVVRNPQKADELIKLAQKVQAKLPVNR